jgi:hypothetical protein
MIPTGASYGKSPTPYKNRRFALQVQVLTDEYRHRDTVVLRDVLNCRLSPFRAGACPPTVPGKEAGSDGSYELGPSSGAPDAIFRAA